MPVTAKLSRKFYERFGDDIANELADWFNKVDESYRAELRDLNDRNCARFEAKLEQRLSELRAELREGIAQLGAGLRTEMAALGASLEDKMHRQIATQTRWMVGLWLVQTTAITGTLLAVLRDH